MASGTVSTSAASSTVITISSPSAGRARESVTTVPFIVTAPVSISRARRERLRLSASGTARASALSRRGSGSGPMRTRTRRGDGMGDGPENETEMGLPRDLRFLKTLVTVLTAAMILGVIAITALLVIRLNDVGTPIRLDPGDFVLPEGVGIVGISVVDGVTVIVGDDRVIRLFDSETRALLREMPIGP
jgi:hypothetical protein